VIYYESRLAKLELVEAEKPKIDPDFEEVTEGEEAERKEKLKSKWAQLEAVVGSDTRLELVAQDIVEHFEKRLEAMDGKMMVVCMSRRICMDLHDEIVKLRPDWYHADDDKGMLKVVMTGASSESPRVAEHARNKARREAMANRFRDPKDPLRLVIVRDMWLTGFDAPCMHTMYVDKPMRGHGLMQAIARARETHPAQARLPARQTGESDADCTGTGRSSFRGMGDRIGGVQLSAGHTRPIIAHMIGADVC